METPEERADRLAAVAVELTSRVPEEPVPCEASVLLRAAA